MEVALSVRVSTTRQHQAQTIDQQLDRLLAHGAQQKEWQLADEHSYRDAGSSGAKIGRPGLDRLRDRAAFAAFERVLITAADRVARTSVQQMLLIDELAQRGCHVELLDRPMRDDPHDQLLRQIRGAVAEYERNLIADRMRRGRHARLRTGQLLPWTRAPDGEILDVARPRDPSRVWRDPVKAALECRQSPGQSALAGLGRAGRHGSHPERASTAPKIGAVAGRIGPKPASRASRGVDRHCGARTRQPGNVRSGASATGST